ncbi:MAG: ComEA family DNA-binding protein [Candidatus Acidiferrales bacterium]
MAVSRTLRVLTLCSLTAALIGLVGCSSQDQRQRDEKTREAAADATARAKPALRAAGRDLSHAAQTAAEEAHAAAQGVAEGWKRGGQRPVDLNSASESDLLALPGITRRDARRIIADRPYRDPRDLVSRGILSEDTYAGIRDRITVTQ